MARKDLCAQARKAGIDFKADVSTVNEIMGRTVIAHSDPEGFNAQPAGNAGKR